MDSFSKRHGYRTTAPAITIREDAPEFLRASLLRMASEEGLAPSQLRDVICDVLRVLPDRNNWSEYPNIAEENEHHLRNCDWYRVYDIAEAVFRALVGRGARGFPTGSAASFESKLNSEMVDDGVGWQMVGGTIQTRGEESFERTVRSAVTALEGVGQRTAATEIHEAIADMSRRPMPDATGAIQHSMAALECLAREVVGDRQPTLGDLLKRYRDKLGIPRPLDVVVEKLWGYSSEFGRHLQEGREPGREESELVVSLVSSLCIYLSRTSRKTARPAFTVGE